MCNSYSNTKHEKSTCRNNNDYSNAGKWKRTRDITSRNNGYSEAINLSFRDTFDSSCNVTTYGIRSLQDDRTERKVNKMEYRRSEGVRAGFISSSNNTCISDNSTFSIRKRSWIRSLLLASSIPFAVLSTTQAKVSASWFDNLNPIPVETRDKFFSIVNFISGIVDWIKNLPENLAKWSVDLMVWIYEIVTKVVLQTPAFFFNSEWFKTNIITFTGLSIVMSIALAMFEGLKRMGGHLIKDNSSTDMTRITKRIPLVVLGSAIAPALFYYGFKGLNWLTNTIIDLGRIQMEKGIGNFEFSHASALDIIAFIGFDIALITMMIPVLLQNFRRWFDILALGILTPLALSCWVFKAHEHMFTRWWEHLKQSSMTQLVYAIFLVIIGSLMFGTKTPDTERDLLIQIGIIVGGLWRLSSPPSIVSRRLDNGTNLKGMWNGAGKILMPKKAVFDALGKKLKPTK